MSAERDFDLLVFGATGLVGRYVSENLLTTSPVERWAVCGRSQERLDSLVAELCKKHPSATCLPTVVVADAQGAPADLEATAARAHVIINCAGPYARLGAGVVSACVSAGTHYVDVSGEPVHIIGSYHKHNTAAAECGVLIVPACGFSSMVADVLCTADMCKRMRVTAQARGVQRPRMVIEMFGQLVPGEAGYCVNTGTLDSTLGGVRSIPEAARLERTLPAPAQPRAPHPHRFQFGIYRELRLPGAPVVSVLDSEVLQMKRTLRLVDAGIEGTSGMPGSDEVAFRAFAILSTWGNVLRLILSVIVCALVNLLPGGRGFVLRHAERFTWGFFGKNGPSEEQVRTTSVDLTFFGQWKSKDGREEGHEVVRARLPEPTYVATSRMAIAAALTILEDRESLPKGGVMTPAIAFNKSDILVRLEKIGAFEYVEQ